ncbi:GNAT family N-acetyltransferase [Acinetobacter sp. 161(2023)]|uniref:GNAT family N-acetyltransferase n=1 Tax=Acinetobacter sp. 161(2023) TaxID=3098768 RepID=UPI00300B52D5
MRFGVFTSADLEEGVGVYCSAFSSEPWNEQFDDLEPIRKYFESYFQYSCSFGFCAKWENQLIGVGMGHIHPTVQGFRYYLDDFFIHSQHQGKGVGSKLLNYIEVKCRENNIETIVLHTLRESISEDFYKKRGFKTRSKLISLAIRL